MHIANPLCVGANHSRCRQVTMLVMPHGDGKPRRCGSLGALALVPMDPELSCQSLSSVTYLVGWHLQGSVAPNKLMSHPGTMKLTPLG